MFSKAANCLQEIYVISNTDTRSHQVLDLWLESIDTMNVHPLFDRAPREFSISAKSDTDWSEQSNLVQRVARDRQFERLREPAASAAISDLLKYAYKSCDIKLAAEIYDYLIPKGLTFSNTFCDVTLVRELLAFLVYMPANAAVFTRICPWNELPSPLRSLLVQSAPQILKSLVQCANMMEDLVLRPFEAVLRELADLSTKLIQDLAERISLQVQSPQLCLELFLEIFEPLGPQLMTAFSPITSQYFLRNLFGIALDHCDEAEDAATARKELWTFDDTNTDLEGCTLRSRRRIDAPQMERLAAGDHVRFTRVGEPSNVFIAHGSDSFDALVEKVEPGLVTFRCLRHPPIYIDLCSWKLNHCGSFVTSRAMFDALKELVENGSGRCGVYEQLLSLPTIALSSERPQVPYQYSSELNESQNAAVNASLQGPLTCLWGPPGTGKTYTIVALLHSLLSLESGERILITAPTHNAVDNVLRKYVETSSTSSNTSIPPVRVSTDVRKVADDLKQFTCDAMEGKDINQFPAARRKALKRVQEARLIFTTCVGAGVGLLRKEEFANVIIDEASQQTEPASLIPLVKGCERVILVGDHVQLRATVGKHSQLLDFDVSLFERLWNSTKHVAIRKVMLDTQYRMHPEICQFPSAEFYEHKLLTALSCHNILLAQTLFNWSSVRMQNWDLKRSRCVFIQCSHPEDLGQKSKSNKGQADICREVIRQLSAPATCTTTSPNHEDEEQHPKQSIVILTPYTRQAELLRKLCLGVLVSSIDGFQGQEADIVIYVTVRCNLHGETGFLKDLRRLNVALTRAKAGLIVIGDRETLAMRKEEPSVAVWTRLIDALVKLDIKKPEE